MLETLAWDRNLLEVCQANLPSLDVCKETDGCHFNTESRNRDQNLSAEQEPFATGNGLLK